MPRYQQFRAVHGAIRRLQAEQGEERGGIIWHTQGSGKSLTMVFLVRKLRTLPELRRFKIVVVTDRTDLERQLFETAQLSGEVVQRARNTEELKELLGQPGTGMVFAMIQKYQERDVETEVIELEAWKLARDAAAGSADVGYEKTPGYAAKLVADPGGRDRPEQSTATSESGRGRQLRDGGTAEDAAESPGDTPDDVVYQLSLGGEELFPELNTSEEILVLVDEAHRGHSNTLHANLRRALPNAALIGFTGTPILIGERQRTHEIFGSFIDRYTILQSEKDGMTVPIFYEGRTADAGIADGRTLDQLFEDMFRDRSPAELEAIKRKYATRGHVLEAPRLIAAKARDMLRHYVDAVLPNGFKAQVVATTRRAAVLYQRELEEARRDEVARAEGHFIRWYSEQGKRWVERRVERFAVRIGVRPASVTVRELGYRWGSCTPNGGLNFHWRSVLLPPRIVEYIIAHELVHLIVPDHSAEFWVRLERAMPDYAARKEWLAEEGAGVR